MSQSAPGLRQGHKQLIDLTYQKVTERFRPQTDTPSPVSIVFLMAQRILPEPMISGSIDVGRRRYGRMLTSSANFKDRTITECLAIIHTDIVCVWNFNDPFQYLYSDEFRGLMANLVGTIDGSTPAPSRLTRVDTVSSAFETGRPLILLAPLVLPIEAALGLVQWTRQTYQQLPNVHHKFMAYIVDLVHVLGILFSLTADNDEKKLTRGAVSVAFNAYYDSEMRRNIHRQIQDFDYKVPGRDTVLDKIISLVKTSPIDDDDISSALRRIPWESLAQDDDWLTVSAGNLHGRSNREGGMEYLEEIIILRRAALQLTPPGHPGRFVSLVNLANSLHERFIKSGTLADLDEIIAFCRAASECTAPTPSDRCTSLLNLASSLREKYQKLGLDADLREAIKYATAASVGCPSEQDALCRDCVASCVELKAKKSRLPAPMVRATDTSVKPPGVKQIVQDIIAEVTQTLPLRLLNAYTGALCDRDAQISSFKDSAQYNELQSSMRDSPECKQSIHKTVSKYFGYTTLSHRWGTGEPLLRDVQGHSIYDMNDGEGLAKLQNFCALTLRHGYGWAWSDTCCIDKDSSSELQEAIGSMFSWYRNSALTIVHLSDVSSTTSFADSIWFKRGWTLQELLASPRVLFYTQDWSLYMKCASPNHKADSTIVAGLQKATGIGKLQLENFSPGVDDARSKLQWASARLTTRAEDIAYSLFGIFRLSLPVMYGETAQDALGRLLTVIVSRSGDVSVLDWVGEASSFHSCFPSCLTPYGKAVSLMPSVPSGSSTHNDADLQKERELYNALAQLPSPRFLADRLVMPCIVHQVMRVKLLETSTTTSYCHYELVASGLAPLKLEMKTHLQEGSGEGLPYVLVRPWSSKLLDLLVHADVPGSLLEWLRQPFNALLLKSLRTEYKRVASDFSIIASVEDPASVVNSECQILEIV
ncbi:hypothetical protein F5141DRAFT_588373 [Pisolithus sp. B1]|nr:hypothetical protein F5141DRAFT_588373 [Pisolithus sp. B1]